MARFYGPIGYARTVETVPGVHDELIIERNLYGEEIKNARALNQGDDLNPSIISSTSLSVIADSYALENLLAIRYVKWMGAYWQVTSVDVRRPRLILNLGGVYNGPKQTGAPSTP